MPLYLLWTHWRHFTHKIEFLPTPFLQTPHGCSPESSLWNLFTRHCMTFVLPAFTHVFYIWNCKDQLIRKFLFQISFHLPYSGSARIPFQNHYAHSRSPLLVSRTILLPTSRDSSPLDPCELTLLRCPDYETMPLLPSLYTDPSLPIKDYTNGGKDRIYRD